MEESMCLPASDSTSVIVREDDGRFDGLLAKHEARLQLQGPGSGKDQLVETLVSVDERNQRERLASRRRSGTGQNERGNRTKERERDGEN